METQEAGEESAGELIQQSGEQGDSVPSWGKEVLQGQVQWVKGTAVDVLMRPREGSPTQQCRAMHDCARAKGQGELDTMGGAAAAAAVVAAMTAAAAAADKAESP